MFKAMNKHLLFSENLKHMLAAIRWSVVKVNMVGVCAITVFQSKTSLDVYVWVDNQPLNVI